MASDGRIGSELTRRLGLAKADFDTLSRIWSHAAVGLHRKLEVFDSCITSKLLYSLDTACLSVVERRRLDGFYVRCLRRILRVAPAYYSRVSNSTVLTRARRQPLSSRLLRRQLLLFGELARRSHDDPARSCVFMPGGYELRQLQNLKRGRPRKTYIVRP